jgi:hypothetical protein
MREFLRLTQEAVFGTFNASPSAGQQIFISLPSDNAFTVRRTMDPAWVRSQGVSGRRIKKIARTHDVGGKLTTLVRPSQAALLATLAAGVTSGNCGNLVSFTADHGVYLEDGSCTAALFRYLGCKIADATFAVTNTGEGVNMMADLTIIGKTTAAITGSDLATPDVDDLTALDNETPYAFQDCAGALSIGSARTDFTSVSIHLANKLAPFRGETAAISKLDYRSRDIEVTIANLYKSKQDRTDYEAITAKTLSITFTEGAFSMAFDFGANNFFDAPQDDLKLADGHFMQTVTLQNLVDPATGLDLTITVDDTP